VERDNAAKQGFGRVGAVAKLYLVANGDSLTLFVVQTQFNGLAPAFYHSVRRIVQFHRVLHFDFSFNAYGAKGSTCATPYSHALYLW
jgi:hypothetical protein